MRRLYLHVNPAVKSIRLSHDGKSLSNSIGPKHNETNDFLLNLDEESKYGGTSTSDPPISKRGEESIEVEPFKRELLAAVKGEEGGIDTSSVKPSTVEKKPEDSKKSNIFRSATLSRFKRGQQNNKLKRNPESDEHQARRPYCPDWEVISGNTRLEYLSVIENPSRSSLEVALAKGVNSRNDNLDHNIINKPSQPAVAKKDMMYNDPAILMSMAHNTVRRRCTRATLEAQLKNNAAFTSIPETPSCRSNWHLHMKQWNAERPPPPPNETLSPIPSEGCGVVEKPELPARKVRLNSGSKFSSSASRILRRLSNTPAQEPPKDMLISDSETVPSGRLSREAQINLLSVAELKKLIERVGMQHDDCIEKADLRKRALEASILQEHRNSKLAFRKGRRKTRKKNKRRLWKRKLRKQTSDTTSKAVHEGALSQVPDDTVSNREKDDVDQNDEEPDTRTLFLVCSHVPYVIPPPPCKKFAPAPGTLGEQQAQAVEGNLMLVEDLLGLHERLMQERAETLDSIRGIKDVIRKLDANAGDSLTTKEEEREVIPEDLVLPDNVVPQDQNGAVSSPVMSFTSGRIYQVQRGTGTGLSLS